MKPNAIRALKSIGACAAAVVVFCANGRGAEPAALAAGQAAASVPVSPARAADSLAGARRFQESADAYATALSKWPDSLGIAKRALGVFWRAARYEDAYVWGRRVLAHEPRSLDVLFDLGVTCGFLIETNCVDSLFHRALAIDSTFVDGYGELAFMAQARGRLPEAVGYMEAAYSVAPHDDFSVSGLAQMLIAAGQPGRAREIMRPRLTANRKARAYGGRSMLTLDAWALWATGDTASASAEFDEVLAWLRAREAAGETSYQLYRERAAIDALRGQNAPAIRTMQTAFDRGWRLYGSWSLVDPMFSNVAGDPLVRELVERMRLDVRARRRRLGLDPGAGPK